MTDVDDVVDIPHCNFIFHVVGSRQGRLRLVASRHTGYISSHHDGRICLVPMAEP